ncbi:DUF6249 domain-containing protein [Cellvibrio sp. UBA7661]|uniref:DUF6249 domain-containing protein n=1 Tax=Cellvibrio sp. UBA7661 TaxID=1946311 RepID=UPI002F356324
MILRSPSAHLLGFVLGCVVLIPASAAELEGTPVPVDSNSSVPVSAQTSAAPDPSTPAIAPLPEEPQQQEQQDLERSQEAHAIEQQAHAVAQEAIARDHERRMREHHNWQRDLDKGLQEAFGKPNFDEGDIGLALLIPLFAIVFIFGGPIFLLAFLLVLRYRSRARRQQEINNNIDKLLAAGRDIPVELLRGDEPKSASEAGDLSRGIRNLFLGIGLLIFLTALVGFDIGSIGFIWIAFGCSQTLVWYLNKPKAGSVEQQGQQD